MKPRKFVSATLNFVQQQWRGILLFWLNVVLTLIASAFTISADWGVGIILHLSGLLGMGILIYTGSAVVQDRPTLIEEHAIALTNEAVLFVTDENYPGARYYCRSCGAENDNLKDYPFDPRFHYGTCRIPVIRQALTPHEVMLAPPEYFKVSDDYEDF